ncbi:hypothetical protein [Sinorhizobium meliloti]|uniref:hypothetical protein n=1 Tax=Rhizobium meliloti TaxID=382 RepID=UPI000FD8F450|nr:hypothetical protein [Sinorhizobium meliloti]RVI91820.1 hypothetical protein CN190_03500 [Sinorhizobium meliloti]
MEEGMTAIAEEQAAPAIETQTPGTEPRDEPIDLDAPEQPETEAQASEPEGEQPEGEEGEPSADEPPAEPEFAEIEINGKTYQVPAEIKDGYLMQADYTRKTQEVAEMRRSMEAKAAEIEQAFNMSQEVVEARATLLNIDNELSQFQNVNWEQYENEDPMGAMSAWRRVQQLKEARSQIAGNLDQVQSQRNAAMEQETANRLRETREFAETKIPGWSPDVDAKVTDFAVKELGLTLDTLKSAYTPQVYKTLHLAWLGHQSLQKQQAAPKPSTPPVQPLRTVSAKANASVTKDPAEMSMDEYVAFRNAQMRKK